MGLDIHGLKSGTHIGWSYAVLHRIRWLGALSKGFEGDFVAWMRIGEGHAGTGEATRWDGLATQLPALLHHADSEGGYVPESWLSQVDLSETFLLGSSTALWREMQELAIWVGRNVTGVATARDVRSYDGELMAHAVEAFWKFYDLVKAECSEEDGEPCDGVIEFR